MQAVFEVGIAAVQDPQVHKNSLVREFEESLQWWLHTRPEVCNCSYVPPSSCPSEVCILDAASCRCEEPLSDTGVCQAGIVASACLCTEQ